MAGKRKLDVVHIELVKEGTIDYMGIGNGRISTPEEAVRLASSFFRGADREKVYVLVLNGNMVPVNITLACMGGMAEARIYMAEIFKTAILSNCPNIICLHNHLSGNTQPSEADKIATLQMQFAGKILGIKLQDHIIVGEEGKFFSFQKEGFITDGEWVFEHNKELVG